MIECQLCGSPNDEDARFCAAWNCGAALAGPPGLGIRLSLPDWTPEVRPGRPTTLGARVGNAGTRPDTVAVTVRGLPPGCAEVRPDRLRLAPGEERTVRIRLLLPDPAQLPSGNRRCQVVATSLTDPQASARARLALRLPQAASESAQAAVSGVVAGSRSGTRADGGAEGSVPVPVRRVRWRRRVVIPLTVAHPADEPGPGAGPAAGPGPAERRITLGAVCPTPGAVVRIRPASVTVRPGRAATVRVELRLPRRWVGPPQLVDCRIAGAGGGGWTQLSIAHRPVLPLPLLRLLCLDLRPQPGPEPRRSQSGAGAGAGAGPARAPRRRAGVPNARRASAVRSWLPTPVTTALGAMVVAALAFGGLSLASGNTVRPGRTALSDHGGAGRGQGTTSGESSGSTTSTIAPVGTTGVTGTATSGSGTGGAGEFVPLSDPVTSTPRDLPPTSGCQDAAAVPDVSRQTFPASSRTLLAAGFPGLDIAQHSSTVPVGGTVSVTPGPGTLQPCGSQVTLVYSSGPAPSPSAGGAPVAAPLCVLPPARGPATTVLAKLRALVADDRRTACGLLVTTVDGYSTTVPAGDVISANPLPGTRIGVRSAVVVTVSVGAPTCVLPPVTGYPVAAATALVDAIRAADGSACRPAVVSVTAASATVTAGTVVAQAPGAGTAVPPGAVVTLTVSSGPASPTGSPSTTPPPVDGSPTPGTPGLSASPSGPAPASSVPATGPAAPPSADRAPAATCALPDAAGLTLAGATAVFDAVGASDGGPCGLVVVAADESSSVVAAGLVIGQAPAAGAVVAAGSTVAVIISTGPAPQSPDASASG